MRLWAMSDIFDVRRFLRLFAGSLFQSRKRWLATLASTYFGLVCMAIAIYGVVGISKAESDSMYIGFVIFTVVYFSAAASSAFAHLSKRGSRISFLMLPASNLEKYIVRLLHFTIVLGAVFVIAVVLMELTRWFVAYSFDYRVSHNFNDVLSYFKSFTADTFVFGKDYMSINVSFALLFWLHSLFFLGSALWRKFAASKTATAIIAVVLALIIAGNSGGSAFLSDWIKGMVVGGNACTLQIAANILLAVWIIANYAMAYVKFTRIQIK